MVLSRMLMVIGLFFVVQAVAAESPPQPTQAPKVHNTACSLAESMAGKFATKKMNAADAERTCRQLAPSMNDAERAEFMRCCVARFQQ
jgi:hypothetical protein